MLLSLLRLHPVATGDFVQNCPPVNFHIFLSTRNCSHITCCHYVFCFDCLLRSHCRGHWFESSSDHHHIQPLWELLPQGFLLLWASSKRDNSASGPIPASFKFKAGAFVGEGDDATNGIAVIAKGAAAVPLPPSAQLPRRGFARPAFSPFPVHGDCFLVRFSLPF